MLRVSRLKYLVDPLQLSMSTKSNKSWSHRRLHRSAWAERRINYVISLFLFIFLREPYMSLSWAWWKSMFLIFSERFLSFSTMQTHVQACIWWSKFKTVVLTVFFLFSSFPLFPLFPLFPFSPFPLSPYWIWLIHLRVV